jgi:hypothetical protein
MKASRLAGCCCALLLSGEIFAQDSGFYVGAGAGVAHEGFTGFSGEDAAFKALAGYSFNKYFSVEVAYADAGTIKDDIEGDHVSISNDGFTASVLAKWPVTEVFAPYLKVGYASYDTHLEVTGDGQPLAVSMSESDSLLGAGIEFKLGERFRLRADLDRINVSDANFRIYSLVATYQF